MKYDQKIIDKAKEMLLNRISEPELEATSTQVVRDFLMCKLSQKEHEVFCVLFLDNQQKLIEYEEMFRGTINAASVYPREVLKSALKHNAAAVIFAHNHPSGIAEPSQADRTITERLQQALDLVDIRTLDHIIVGGMETTSFAEKGYL